MLGFTHHHQAEIFPFEENIRLDGGLKGSLGASERPLVIYFAPSHLLFTQDGKAHPDREKTSDLKRNTIESKIWVHSWLCRMCVVWENKEKDAAGTVLTLSACQVWYPTSCCQSFYTSMHRNRYRAIISTELWLSSFHFMDCKRCEKMSLYGSNRIFPITSVAGLTLFCADC